MAEFPPLAVDQYRHQFVVPCLEFGVGIDVQHLDLEIRHPGLTAQGIRVLRYTNFDVSQQLAGIHDDLTTHLERITS